VKCPYCGNPDSRVIDSRPADEGATIRRRRECEKCAKRFTTYEIIERIPLIVVKKDGGRQAFDKEKLIRGMVNACANRPVPIATLQKAADEIETELQNSMNNEVESALIGEHVMDKLKGIDEVAYVRFASVYRHFKDASSFLEEIKKLLETD